MARVYTFIVSTGAATALVVNAAGNPWAPAFADMPTHAPVLGATSTGTSSGAPAYVMVDTVTGEYRDVASPQQPKPSQQDRGRRG